MKSNMSQKDKNLLLFMFLFVVIVGVGYWGIYPQIKAFTSLEGEIEEQEVLQSVNEQKVANALFVEAQCEEYEENMAEDKEKFFDRMSEADVDLFLTTKAIRHKLESFNLNINIPNSPSKRRAYQYSQLYQDQLRWEEERKAKAAALMESDEDALADLTGDSKKDKDKEEEKTTVQEEVVDIFGNTDEVGENNDIYAAQVTMTLGGEKDDLDAFLKEIMESDKEILITAFSWGTYRAQRLREGVVVEEGVELKNSDYELVTMDSLTITMELYMCDKD